MAVITIPKELARKEDLVVIPRSEYEEFLALKRVIPSVKPTKAELKIIRRGEREFREGKYVEWGEIKRGLARRRK